MLYHMLTDIESDFHIGLNIQAFFVADVKVRPNNHTLYPIQSYTILGTQFRQAGPIMTSD